MIKNGRGDFTGPGGVNPNNLLFSKRKQQQVSGLVGRVTILEKLKYLFSVFDDKSPVLGGNLEINENKLHFPTVRNIDDVLDEDTMVSDSDTKLATQQSIKKFVDDHNWTEADITDLGTYLENLVEDTSPQLGGDLDANSKSITSVFKLILQNKELADMAGMLGEIYFDENYFGDFAEMDTDGGGLAVYHSGLAAFAAILSTENMQFVTAKFDGLSFRDGGASVDIIRDEDAMGSDDPLALATQQSIKKYVDDEVAGAGGGVGILEVQVFS